MNAKQKFLKEIEGKQFEHFWFFYKLAVEAFPRLEGKETELIGHLFFFVAKMPGSNSFFLPKRDARNLVYFLESTYGE